MFSQINCWTNLFWQFILIESPLWSLLMSNLFGSTTLMILFYKFRINYHSWVLTFQLLYLLPQNKIWVGRETNLCAHRAAPLHHITYTNQSTVNFPSPSLANCTYVVSSDSSRLALRSQNATETPANIIFTYSFSRWQIHDAFTMKTISVPMYYRLIARANILITHDQLLHQPSHILYLHKSITAVPAAYVFLVTCDVSIFFSTYFLATILIIHCLLFAINESPPSSYLACSHLIWVQKLQAIAHVICNLIRRH